jgi:hypothetical protein
VRFLLHGGLRGSHVSKDDADLANRKFVAYVQVAPVALHHAQQVVDDLELLSAIGGVAWVEPVSADAANNA